MGPLATIQFWCMTVLVYTRRYDLMYALARVQEFYENPEFKGRYFTREQLQLQRHDYYIAWNGCNFPASAVAGFKQKFGDRLDQHEREVLRHVVDGRYTVGVHLEGGGAVLETALRHEFAHALYAETPAYRDLLNELFKLPKEQKQQLVTRLLDMGYDRDVVGDEAQAYAVSGWDKLKLEFDPPSEVIEAFEPFWARRFTDV
jgi:hypothetical protein